MTPQHPRRRAHRAGRHRPARRRRARWSTARRFDRAALLDAIGDADALVVRSATQVDAELIARADQLRVIGRAGVGVDNVDVAAATRRGILVCNAPQSNIVSAAEHTDRAAARRRAQRAAGARGARRGPLGALALRRRRARRQDARRARLRPHRPARRGARARARHADPGVRPARDARALPRARRRPRPRRSTRSTTSSDFITLHLPLTAETQHLISRDALARMRPGARLINAARGSLVDTEALVEALRDGRSTGPRSTCSRRSRCRPTRRCSGSRTSS